MTQVAAYGAVPVNGQASRRQQGISLMVHGFQKQGKSSIADSGPRPVICLDVEVASYWTPSRKIYWNPLRETVPAWPADPRAAHAGNPEGMWDTCIVLTHSYEILRQVNQVLATGQHPFNSVSVDSVPNVQQRVMMALAGTGKMERDQWGILLRQTMAMIMGFRDLLTHPVRPVWAVTFVCQTHYDRRTGKWRPYLAGQAADLVPYQPDVTGWLYTADDGTRHLWSGPSREYETGERLWGRLPHDMQLGYPGAVQGWTVETMVQQVLATQ